MTSSIREWLNLLVRWFHVFAAIMWVGQTYYFTWLDGRFNKLAKTAAAGDKPVHMDGAQRRLLHRGSERNPSKVGSEQVNWFRWEALMTWLSGMVLLVLVYYSSSGLVDPDVADISQARGDRDRARVLIVGWIVYDLALRSPLGRSEASVRHILCADDCRARLGIDPRFQRARGLHPRWGGLRNDYDRECLVPNSSLPTQNDRGSGSRGEV